jgi:hypothetical protein
MGTLRFKFKTLLFETEVVSSELPITLALAEMIINKKEKKSIKAVIVPKTDARKFFRKFIILDSCLQI